MLSYGEYMNMIKDAVIYTHNMNKYSSSLLREMDFIGLNVNLTNITKMSFKLILLEPIQLNDEVMYDIFFNIVQNQFGYYPSYYTVELNNGKTNIFYFKGKHKSKKEQSKNFKDIEYEFKTYIKNENVKKITITFEANYEDGLYKNTLNIPDRLYHISPTIYEDSILKNGIFPKAKQRSSYFPSRIHFLYDITNYNNLIKKFKMNDLKKGRQKLNYTVYEIDTKDIKNNLVLHSDPNSDGCYTYDVIPPKNIKLIFSNI